MPGPGNHQRWRRYLGVELDEVNVAEKAVSTLGGLVSILIVVMVTDWVVPDGSPLTVASIGASAVLLFVVPHGQLSQPWPVFGGQVLSAVIGVAVATWLGTGAVAAALAVGAAILVMQLCKCIHPPGGATALTAVLGGAAITDLGFEFVLSPVLVNTVAILVVAVLFNAVFPWRRYPWYLTSVRPRAGRRRPPEAAGSTASTDPADRTAAGTATGTSAGAPGAGTGSTVEATEPDVELTHRAVVEALRNINSFIDVTEDDLVRLHRMISEIEREALGTDDA